MKRGGRQQSQHRTATRRAPRGPGKFSGTKGQSGMSSASKTRGPRMGAGNKAAVGRNETKGRSARKSPRIA